MTREEEKEVRDLIVAIDSLHENDMIGYKKDIARSLKNIYADLQDSKDDEMDVELGEIYRELLKEVFYILGKHDIHVNN